MFDYHLVDQLDELERLKCWAAAEQVRLTAALDDLRTGRSDASIGAEVGIARHESPQHGRELLGLARALVDDLPETLAALDRGDINERRAQIIARETRDLTAEDRHIVDREIAGSLAELGDRRVSLAVRRIVMRIDDAGAARRRENALRRRRVSGYLLADGTGLISAVVSEVHYAAIMTSLSQRANLEKVRGDERTHGQLVADLFVARLTGQVTAQAVPVTLNVVVSAEALLGDDEEPADLPGFGPIPASVARRMAGASPEQATRIRRLFRLDDTDRLIAMESSSRSFGSLLASFLRIRDQICRSPWCNASIRQLDHPTRVADGGRTSEINGQGLCEACNYVKESPGWRHRAGADTGRHQVEVTTPAGRTVVSRAPTPPRAEPAWIQRQPGVWVRAA